MSQKLNDNNNTTMLLLNKVNLNRTKSVIDEANYHVKIMKKGEYFKKIINEKGKTVEHLITLSPDESYISITYNRCCKRTEIIYLENISTCEVGYSNNFYMKKKFENYITIVLKNNKSYEFYHQIEGNSKKWVNSINYLLQKKRKNLENEEIKLDKKDISNIWQTEVIPNWNLYRKYLHDKNKESYFTRKRKANKKKMDIKKDLQENIEILQANKEEILYLWTLGLPPWLRKYLWNIVIGNELEITENLFQGFIKTIFREYINNQNMKTSYSTFCTSLISNDNNNNNINLVKDITNDIELYYKRHENIIKAEKKINFKEDVLVIVRSFCFFRLDIIYQKDITEIASFIYLNTNNYYDAFRILCNFITPSYLFDYLQSNVEKFKNYCEFFELLMQKYVPLLYNYFQSINFQIEILFYKWTKNLFLKAFNYNLCLLIFDNFIIKGKIFIFQVAIAILVIKHKEILSSDLNALNFILKKNQLDIDEKILFSEIEKLDIRDEYKEFFDIYSLGKEKIELFQDL